MRFAYLEEDLADWGQGEMILPDTPREYILEDLSCHAFVNFTNIFPIVFQ